MLFNPDLVCRNLMNSVKWTMNIFQVTYKELLMVLFDRMDPTTLNRYNYKEHKWWVQLEGCVLDKACTNDFQAGKWPGHSIQEWDILSHRKAEGAIKIRLINCLLTPMAGYCWRLHQGSAGQVQGQDCCGGERSQQVLASRRLPPKVSGKGKLCTICQLKVWKHLLLMVTKGILFLT